jgi:hypothetical protein
VVQAVQHVNNILFFFDKELTIVKHTKTYFAIEFTDVINGNHKPKAAQAQFCEKKFV